MKKFVKLMAIVLVVAMLGVMLVSCGLSGTYEGPLGASLVFDGKNVSGKVGSYSLDTGTTYKIKDDKIYFYTAENEDGETEEICSFDYKKDGDTITLKILGVGVDFTKKD